MAQRVSFWGGVSLSLLMLGGCLLADVGIDPALDEEIGRGPLEGGAGAGGSGGPSSNGGGSGSGSLPAAGSGGGGGSEGNVPVTMLPPAAGGSANSGSAGSGGAGTGGGTGVAGSGAGGSSATPPRSDLSQMLCPDGLDREQACAAYCGAYTMVCADFEVVPIGGTQLAHPYDYAGSGDCATFCREEAPWDIGTIGQFDSIMCRCHHASLAITDGPNPHCFHAARVPTQGGCQAPLPAQ